MRMMTKLLLCSVALIALLTTQANAGLIRVEYDNLTTSDANVMPGQAFSIKKTLSDFGGVVDVDKVAGTLSLTNASTVTVTHTVTGGNFGDVFATSGASGSLFDGFSINALRTGGLGTIGTGQTSVSIWVGGVQVVNDADLTDGFNDFRNIASPLATEVKFVISNNRPANAPPGNLVINGFYAVPEPSAMLLVGSLIGLGFTRRRRA